MLRLSPRYSIPPGPPPPPQLPPCRPSPPNSLPPAVVSLGVARPALVAWPVPNRYRCCLLPPSSQVLGGGPGERVRKRRRAQGRVRALKMAHAPVKMAHAPPCPTPPNDCVWHMLHVASVCLCSAARAWRCLHDAVCARRRARESFPPSWAPCSTSQAFQWSEASKATIEAASTSSSVAV